MNALTHEQAKKYFTIELCQKFKNVARKTLEINSKGNQTVNIDKLRKILNDDKLQMILFAEYMQAVTAYTGGMYGAIISTDLGDIRSNTRLDIIAKSMKVDGSKEANRLYDFYKNKIGYDYINASGVPKSDKDVTIDNLKKYNFILSKMVSETGYDESLGMQTTKAFEPADPKYGLSAGYADKQVKRSKQYLFRGIKDLDPKIFLSLVQPGKKNNIGKFASFSTDPQIAASYATPSTGSPNPFGIFFTVFNPNQKGQDVDTISVWQGEKEIITGGMIVNDGGPVEFAHNAVLLHAGDPQGQADQIKLGQNVQRKSYANMIKYVEEIVNAYIANPKLLMNQPPVIARISCTLL